MVPTAKRCRSARRWCPAHRQGHRVGTAAGEKVRIFKMRRRKHYRKTQGHRQNYTRSEIDRDPGLERRRSQPAPITGVQHGTQESRRQFAQRSRLQSKRLGVKRFGGSARHRGQHHRAPARHQVHPGDNVGMGRDHTLFAKA
jgi:ribosomal protein L27